MHYSNNYRKKILKQLTADPKFMDFAREEFEERKSIKGVFCFRDNFADDLQDNLEHYNTIWQDHKMLEQLFTLNKDTQKQIMNTALLDVLKKF